jgi:hypothetical protein
LSAAHGWKNATTAGRRRQDRVFAIVAATGNIYSGLWYPIVVACMSLIVGFLFLPETKDVDITTH